MLLACFLIKHGVHLAVGRAGADHEEVGQAAQPAQIKHADVLGLAVGRDTGHVDGEFHRIVNLIRAIDRCICRRCVSHIQYSNKQSAGSDTLARQPAELAISH